MNSRGEYHHLTVYSDLIPFAPCIDRRGMGSCARVSTLSGSPAMLTAGAAVRADVPLRKRHHAGGDMEKATRLIKTASVVAKCSESCMRKGGDQADQADCFSGCLQRRL